MVFDLSSLSRTRDFIFDTQAIGSVHCGAVSYTMQTKLAGILKVPDVDSLKFSRQLLHLVCTKMTKLHKQKDLEVQKECLADNDINKITEEEIEIFASQFIVHNEWLLDSYTDGEQQVRTNEKGERVVSRKLITIDLPKEETENNADYLIRIFRNYFSRESEITKCSAKTATENAMYFSSVGRFANDNSTTAILASMNQHQYQLQAINAFDKMKHIQDYSLMNAVITAQNQRDQELLWSMAHQAAEAKLHIEEVSQSLLLAKSIYHNEDIMRSFAQQEQIQRMAISASITSTLAKQQQDVFEMMKKHEMLFRRPEAYEVTTLLHDSQVGAVARFAQHHCAFITDNQRVLEAITTPWLHRTEAERSVTAFLELQGLGNALKSMNGFDLGFTEALRQDFGDWRDRITFPQTIFTDSVARTDFYTDRGFDTALTDFPDAAFHQNLELAELDDVSLDLELYGSATPRPTDPEEEAGLQRTNRCHDHLQRFERLIRKFIDKEMTVQYGLGWPKRLAPAIYEKWTFKRQQAEKNGGAVSYIDTADFTDYETIICRPDHWRDVFESRFKRKESVRESFQRLYPIRITTMHSRIVTKEDELFLVVEIMRLIRAVKQSPSH